MPRPRPRLILPSSTPLLESCPTPMLTILSSTTMLLSWLLAAGMMLELWSPVLMVLSLLQWSLLLLLLLRNLPCLLRREKLRLRLNPRPLLIPTFSTDITHMLTDTTHTPTDMGGLLMDTTMESKLFVQ